MKPGRQTWRCICHLPLTNLPFSNIPLTTTPSTQLATQRCPLFMKPKLSQPDLTPLSGKLQWRVDPQTTHCQIGASASTRFDRRFRHGRNFSVKSTVPLSRATSLRPTSQLNSKLLSQLPENGTRSGDSIICMNTLLSVASEGSTQPSISGTAKLKHSEFL